MKKINLALPILLGTALTVSACAKQDETTNITSSDVVLNDESPVTDGNFAGGADPLADNAAGPDNAVVDNAAGELGNGQ
ncbi:hypothetical protein ASG11_05655 [Sphingomonas sp. Leaf357]|uniref:hypothetical protein n=1 Tax=Sphingomonas sp. Leaf357 TaxID=1736350 RepID=UPI0006FAE48B|nr:hypothetical protein [Sphingomonas sp. Leaf357]KQS03792.1 hypothetical protein ASG11_05655 [Sphingomonas sp. Leaf357]